MSRSASRAQVDLPEPDSPISATVSPASIEKEMPLTAWTTGPEPGWNCLLTFSSRTSGMLAHPLRQVAREQPAGRDLAQKRLLLARALVDVVAALAKRAALGIVDQARHGAAQGDELLARPRDR